MWDDNIKPVTIQVILASSRVEDRDSLDVLLADSPWKLVWTTSREAAVTALHEVAVPVVLCDQELDEQPWQETLRALTNARRRTCVIVLSNLGDPGLWSEVARRGGFDLLSRPFEREQVYATLICALAQYKMSRPVVSRRRPAALTSVV